MKLKQLKQLTIMMGLIAVTNAAWAGKGANCPDITYDDLTQALKDNTFLTGGVSNGGLDFHMWATVVAPDGTVCLVTKTGDDLNAQWLGSRVISAQKANTAVAFSLYQGLALSTANLHAPTQPGASLFGLQFSNPVDTKNAYGGNSKKFGTKKDPMVGKRVGGVNVFGGGVALYNTEGKLVGALGVSGDTSCADHNVAWRVRNALGFDNLPGGGVNSDGNDDNIIYDEDGKLTGFEHPDCGNKEKEVNATLPPVKHVTP